MFNYNKSLLLILTAFKITLVTSLELQTSKFSSTAYDPFYLGAESETSSSSRVKRQSRTCPLTPIDCSRVPNVNKFRTIDGTCNNLANPYWGASDIPFIRYIKRTPSGSSFRCPGCPRVRDVCFDINSISTSNVCEGYTVMLMQWGQFVDHDLVFTPTAPENNCCADFVTPNPSASCVPIDVKGDPFYSSLSPPKNCLPFTRSTAANPQCLSSGHTDRETINQLTAFLDGSMVYGSNAAVSNSLRSFVGGKLKIGPGSESTSCPNPSFNICPRSFLPVRNSAATGQPQFFAGDVRVEEQPALTSMHTACVRLHNDLADVINCGNDELTFQVVRKIVIAIIQQVTYGEFLPLILGPTYMNDASYGLPLKPATTSSNTYNNEYNPNLIASAPHAFSICYRFGHSLIPNIFELSSGSTNQLSQSFNNHDVTLNSNSHPSHFLGGIINQCAMPMDHGMVRGVTDFLFARSPFQFGSDLCSRNIQRGRDHGVPGYVEWYNACVDGDPSRIITSFDDLYNYNVMPREIIDVFFKLYDKVEDIDLFPAGISEYKLNGAVIGPTFACIIAEHFANIKKGDRFWFEKQGVFTLRQIQSIRRTTLAAIICLYTNVETSQNKVMEIVNQGNPKLQCSDILKNGVLNDITLDIWSGICSQ